MKSVEIMNTITVRPSGRHFVSSEGEVILDAAIRAGVELPYTCRDGACGSCKCRLIEGSVEQRENSAFTLNSEDRSLGYILTCQSIARSDLVLETERVTKEGTSFVKKLRARVASIDKPTDDVAIIRLELKANAGFQYRAGQFIDIKLGDRERRSYSIANEPGAFVKSRRLELHLRHLPGGKFTDHVFSAMKVKDVLEIEGPHGGFFLREDSEKAIVLLASGTGLAPIKSIIEYMRSQGIRREAYLYWGVRRRHQLYDDEWARNAVNNMPNLRYIPVLSEPCVEDHWNGRTGFVHEAVMRDFPSLAQHQVYACGLPIVVNSAKRDFVALCGLPEKEFYADAFLTQADFGN
jgi:CDP-4-dehydro-6-deoxyglucose reductase